MDFALSCNQPRNCSIVSVTTRCPGRSLTRQELLCVLTCMHKAWLDENYRLPWCREVYERHSLLSFKLHWILRNVPYYLPWMSCFHFFFIRKQNISAYVNCVLYRYRKTNSAFEKSLLKKKKKNVDWGSEDDSWKRLFRRKLLCLGCENVSLNLF